MTLSVLDGPTIPAGQSLSNAIDCSAGRIVRIATPQAWTMAPLSFQVSSDGVNFRDLTRVQDNQGIYTPLPVQVSVVPLNSSIVLPPETGYSVVWLKIRSGTPSVPVRQGADRKFQVMLDSGAGAGSGGAAGPAGPQGPQGIQGPAGEAGVQGIPGPAGPQGSEGFVGPTGPAGETVILVGHFSERAIAELPPSGYIPADWDAPNNPPLGNQVTTGQGMLHVPSQTICVWVGPALVDGGWIEMGNVQGPAGPAGPPGAEGPVGAEGPQGVAGAPGPEGPQGIPGSVGPAGAVGASGPAGPSGSAGGVGATGPAGALGPTGATGAAGAVPAGATGATAGWQQVGNIIRQWGQVTATTAGVDVTFPKPYVNDIPSVVTSGQSGGILQTVASKTGFNVKCNSGSPIVYWQSIGS